MTKSWEQLNNYSNERQQEEHSNGVGAGSVPSEMVDNSDTTSCYDLPPLPDCLRISASELLQLQSDQPASEPYYYPTQGTVIAPQVSIDSDSGQFSTERSPIQQCYDWPSAGSSHRGDNLLTSSALQYQNPVAESAGILTQQNTISDLVPRQLVTGESSSQQGNDLPLAGNCPWGDNSRLNSALQFQTALASYASIQSQPNAHQIAAAAAAAFNQLYMVNNYGGANRTVPTSRSPAGGISSCRITNALFPSTFQFRNSRGNAIPIPRPSTNRPYFYDLRTGNAIISTPTNISNGTGAGAGDGLVKNTNANLGKRSGSEELPEDAKPVKRGVGRPRGSTSAKKELETKSSGPAPIGVFIQQIQIGQWQCTSKTCWGMSAKIHFHYRKLLWEIYCPILERKKKMAIHWNSIHSMESIPELFQLKHKLGKGMRTRESQLKLKEPPSFHLEEIVKVKTHSNWNPSKDFTDGEALRFRAVHTLTFGRYTYIKYMNGLMTVEKLRELLNKGMREEDDSNVTMLIANAPSNSNSVQANAEPETTANNTHGTENCPTNDDTECDSLREQMSSDQVPYDVPLLQSNEPGGLEYMRLEPLCGSVNDLNGMNFPMTTDFLESELLLPETGNSEDEPLENLSTSWDDIDWYDFE